jgi:hypothetical protein
MQMSNHGPYKTGLYWVGNTLLNALVDGLGAAFDSNQEYDMSYKPTFSRPELRQDYPLNLSISLSGGKETNKDSPSNGERTGNSPT